MTQHGMKVTSGKALTAELRKLSAQVHDVLPDGTQVTRHEALATLLWNQALGFVEEYRDENGTLCKKRHPPVAWALQYVYERMEGKTPQAMPDEGGRMKASQKIGELAKDRINKLARKNAVSVTAGPPKHKPKESK